MQLQNRDLSRFYIALQRDTQARATRRAADARREAFPHTHNAIQCALQCGETTTEPTVVQEAEASAVAARDSDAFAHIDNCLLALRSFDNTEWQRSYHQKQFHDNFLRASARVFFKRAPAGAFNRCYQHVLRRHGWDHLAQEILVSTPRRFGKTISVSMFAAAMIFAAPSVEVSIYSTCKRISQKLLRNVQKFLDMIFKNTQHEPFRVIRCNMEEVVLQGPIDKYDVRVINSYPSKVGITTLVIFFRIFIHFNRMSTRLRHYTAPHAAVALIDSLKTYYTPTTQTTYTWSPARKRTLNNSSHTRNTTDALHPHATDSRTNSAKATVRNAG